MDVETSSKPLLPSNSRFVPVGVAIAWLALFSATFSDLLPRWMQWDSALAHGIPVVLIFFYLLWKTGAWQRQTLISPTLDPWFSIAGLFTSSLLWFFAYAVNIQILEQLMLLPILILAYATIFGWRTVLYYRFLLLFLIFAVPLWGSLNGLLLEAASLVVGQLVRWVEMPALIQGNSIYIPYGHILIADGCSGLRYFVIALTLAYLIGYLNGYKEGKLLLILSVAAVLGLITNWIRIFILIVIGYKTQMESSLMADHELFGWILFGVIFLPTIYFAPVVRRSVQTAPAVGTSIKTSSVAFALLVLATGPVLGMVLQLTFERVTEEASGKASVLSAVSGLSSPAEVHAPSNALTSIEVLPGKVFFRQDIYHRNNLNEKLVPYLPRLYDHQRWMNPVDESHSFGSCTVRYQELSQKGGNDRVAQIQWFNVGGHVTGSSTMAKLLQIPATLKRNNRFSITTLQARCQVESCDRAKEQLLAHAEKEIQKALKRDSKR